MRVDERAYHSYAAQRDKNDDHSGSVRQAEFEAILMIAQQAGQPLQVNGDDAASAIQHDAPEGKRALVPIIGMSVTDEKSLPGLASKVPTTAGQPADLAREAAKNQSANRPGHDDLINAFSTFESAERLQRSLDNMQRA
jgi:hypothetical protein